MKSTSPPDSSAADNLPLLAWVVVALLAVGTGLGAYVAWNRVDWDVEQTGMQGDSIAPIAAALSGLTLLAALWSLHLQRVAMREQRAAFKAEAANQRDAIEEQRRLLTAELDQQHAARRRDAYAKLFAAVDVYRAYVLAYARWLDKYIGAKRSQRVERSVAPSAKYEEVLRANWECQLIDPDVRRRELRASVARHQPLEPALGEGDDKTTMRRHFNTIMDWARAINSPGRELVVNLVQEFDKDVDSSRIPDQVFSHITHDPSVAPTVE